MRTVDEFVVENNGKEIDVIENDVEGYEMHRYIAEI